MDKIPREFLSAAERVLRDYPERVSELKHCNEARKEWLERYVGMVQKGLGLLSDKEREVMKLLFWDELMVWETADALKTYEKSIWRIKTRGLRKLAPLFMPQILE